MRLLNLAVCPAFLAALLAPSLAPANELLRVHKLATRNDARLQAAAGARDAALEAKPQARALWLPQANASGSYTYSQQDTLDSNTPAFQETSDTGISPSAQVQVTQRLLDSAAWAQFRQSDKRVALALATYRGTEQALVLRVTEAFFNVLATGDNARFADAEKKAVERSLELAKKRFEVGLSAITDVQEAQARYDLTVAQMIEAEQALASAREALAEITGTTDVKLESLKEEMPLEGPNPDSVADWLKAAADNNLDLQASQLQAEIAEDDIVRARGGHLPTVSVVGQGQYNENLDFQFGRETLSTSAGVQVNVPLFAGGATQSAVRQARSTHEQRVAELESRRREVERTTKNAYQGVIAGVSRVKALKQAVVSNTTALDASEVGLEVGTRTAVDVLNAQRELYRAQRDYSRARYDYLLNVLRLKSAAGQLGQKDLIEIDTLLVTDGGSEVAG